MMLGLNAAAQTAKVDAPPPLGRLDSPRFATLLKQVLEASEKDFTPIKGSVRR
jgi:hypothetical protein